MPRLKAALLLLSLATVSVPVALRAQATDNAVPGSLNFTQGETSIDGQPLDPAHPAAPLRTLQPGQTLATENGSADLLLARGALLRLGSNSTVHMVAAEAGRTEIRLEAGRANVTVNVVRKDHLLLIDLQNGQTQILSPGLYTFNTATNTLRVFNGEAFLFPGADTTSNIKPVTVKEGHEIIVGGEEAKSEKFDRELVSDDLLPWNGPRESRAVLADAAPDYSGDGSAFVGNGYGDSFGASGFFPGTYGFGYGPYYGLGSPFGFGPYGYGGYPFYGAGFGYWGGYGAGYYAGTRNHYPPLKGPGSFGERGPIRQGMHGFPSGIPRGTVGPGRGPLGGGARVGGGGMHMGGGGIHR